MSDTRRFRMWGKDLNGEAFSTVIWADSWEKAGKESDTYERNMGYRIEKIVICGGNSHA